MKINRSVVLPNLITIGNGICGFAALVKIFKVRIEAGEFVDYGFFVTAAWLVILGMVFDVFDGKVARLSGKTSDLGAQLDSFSDLVTFGLAPALLVVRLNMVYNKFWWGNLVWLFGLAYFVGAMLRLARFNAENEHDPSAHLCFKGLPSPAAAGCIVSLVIFYFYIQDFGKSKELVFLAQYISPQALKTAVGWIPPALPFLALLLGFIMVSNRLKYEHIAGRIFNRSHTFDYFAYLIFGLILLVTMLLTVPEVILPLAFIGYLLYTPAKLALNTLRHRPAGAFHEAREGKSGNGAGAGADLAAPEDSSRMHG